MHNQRHNKMHYFYPPQTMVYLKQWYRTTQLTIRWKKQPWPQPNLTSNMHVYMKCEDLEHNHCFRNKVLVQLAVVLYMVFRLN